MNILITGSNGQLGSEFKNIKDSFNSFNFFFTDVNECDITSKKSISEYIIFKNIYCIINCAAFTNVDNAEIEIKKARKLNELAVQNLVEICQENNIKLIHISTDYVFDGSNSHPYRESDQVSPVGVYGKTKRGGELAVINSEIDGIVIRTSWLYSTFGNNFLKTMLRIGKEKESVNVISDQIGTPTYARNLANTCLDILLISGLEKISKKAKIYHYSNEGVTSWYGFAVLIMELAELNCQVNPILTKDYSTLAKRPNYSVLDKENIKTDFNIDIQHWKESLKECIIKLKK